MDIATVTGIMVIHHSNQIRFDPKRAQILSIALLVSFICVPQAEAFEWQLGPSLSVSEMFSDNLTLSNDDKENGFVTDVSPGLSFTGSSPWSNLNLNYRLQGLYNAGGQEAFDVRHQMQMSSLYQAVRNSLYLETSSSISQQNANNAFIATDNLSGPDNRVESKTFNISPYWTPHFGRFANGLLRVGYNRSDFDNVQNNFVEENGYTANLISNTQTYTKQASLSSGSYFNVVQWSLNYNDRESNRQSGNDVNFESYSGNLRYFINHKFNVFAQGGYENNDFQTLSQNISNGLYYTFGGQWRPSQYYSLEAGAGNNQHVTLQFNPSTRLTSSVTYRNKDVGLNLGSSWDALFNYNLGQSNWGFTYRQDTTTVQQVLVDRGLLADPLTGQVIIDPVTNKALVVDSLAFSQSGLANNFNFIGLPSLVDDVIIVKRANLNFGYQTGKSHFNANAYNERRTYEQSLQEDNVYGISGGWQWQFAPRLSFFLQPLWQSTDGIANNKRYDVALGLSRPLPINLGRPLIANTRLELRHIEQISEKDDFDFTENRATANFAVQF